MHISYYFFTAQLAATEMLIQRKLYRNWQKANPAYQEWGDNTIQESILQFLDAHRPLDSDMSLTACIQQYSLPDTANLINQLKADGIVVKVTTDGNYVSQRDAQTLQERRLQYAPLRELYLEKTLVDGAKTYPIFYKKQKYNVTLYSSWNAWSDRGSALYYPSSKKNQALYEIKKWKSIQEISLDMIPSGCLSIQIAAKNIAVDPAALFDKAMEQDTYVKVTDEIIFLKESDYRIMKSRISCSHDVKPLIGELCQNYDKTKTTDGYQIVINKVEAGLCPGIYRGSQHIGLNTSKYYYDIQTKDAVISAITSVLDTHFLIKLAKLIPLTGYTTVQLKKLIDSGVIAGESNGRAYYTSAHECKRIEKLHLAYVGIDLAIDKAVEKAESDFKYNINTHQKKLYEFIQHHHWWGLKHIAAINVPELNPKNNLYFISSQCQEALETHLSLWLAGFGKSSDEKCELLIRHFKKDYPKTCASLSAYFAKAKSKDKIFSDAAKKEMLDFLFYLMDEELSQLNEDELQNTIILPFSESASIVSKNMLVTYLFDAGYTARQYEFDKTGYSHNVSAYNLDAFSCITYTVLNPEAWASEDLITKAVKSKRFAEMWLFVALHLFAAWRSTDFIRVPCPSLNYAPEEVLRLISEGLYTKTESQKVTTYFMTQLKGLGMCPNKTKDTAYVPELKMFVPMSCEDAFGIILSIAAAHYQLLPDCDTFVIKRNQICDIRKFFGAQFAKACDDTSFSTRRANKSLMQAVEGAAGQMVGSMPYVIAACMRSHKGGYAKLPETTERYLKDAGFSGYSPEYILYHMFQRGICSFYFDAIFKAAFGDAYKKLSISNQTALIKETGLQAYTVDKIKQTVERTHRNVVEITKKIVQSSTKSPQEMLYSILNGDAIGKNWESLCVLRCADIPCRCPSRLQCLGCEYEIKTKSLLSKYIMEYERIRKECDTASVQQHPIEYGRRQHMINTTIVPAIYEVLQMLPDETSAQELDVYAQMIEGRLYHGDAN